MTYRFAIALLVAVCLTGPARACLSHERYPTFWSKPPIEPKTDEVVLRVMLQARTFVDDGDGFRTSCDGGSYIFRVVGVLAGAFAGDEIAIIHPVIGDFVNKPKVGDERIVVGRILPPQAFEARYRLEPNLERHALGPPGDPVVPALWPREISGPSRCPCSMSGNPR